MTFFEKLLPSQGLVCVAQAMSKGFKHHFYEDREAALRQINVLDANEQTVYLAQATFGTSESRKSENAVFLRNFFLDIDCGPEDKYRLKNQKDGVDALKRFCDESGLPFPAVVSSGNGLYAHWFIGSDIPAQQWRSIARLFKSVVMAYTPELQDDASRTADISSVLRPPGTTHRKDPNNKKAVRFLKDAEPIALSDFVDCVKKAAAAKKINTEITQPVKANKGINAEFCEGIDDGPKADPSLIAGKCSQIGYVRSQKGNVSEPLWYATLGVVGFGLDSEETACTWSSGHPDYTQSATLSKMQQWLDQDIGPTTCKHFHDINPDGCIGCKYKNKFTSPIRLGFPEPEAKKDDETGEQNFAPKKYRRAEDGIYQEVEGEWARFYENDLYPSRIAFDESLGYEVTTIRHHLPHEGWLEFTMRSSNVNDSKQFLTTLYDNHVKVVGAWEKKAMQSYVESFSQQLQKNRRMSQLLCQMGWKDTRDGQAMFVLGKKIFHNDGSVEEATLAKNVPNSATGFRSAGTLEAWAKGTEALNRPNMEPFIFTLLCGFGAPLMKFTGFDGAMVSMTGASGAGKTLMLRLMLSIYGHHNDLMMMHKDTQNALVSRLGVYGTLPLAIDEVTNIEGKDLSDLAYRITQGRDKARLTKNAEERKNLNAWNTIAVVSSNASLCDRLNSLKHDASAEINRIIEYPVAPHADFHSDVTTDLYWMLHQNFGLAGEKYVQWLVQNVERLKPGIESVRQKIDKMAEIRGEERFWSAVAAAAIYGGAIAKNLGLIRFDVAQMIPWIAKTIKDMRGVKDELADTAVGVLGQFLDEHASNRLMVRGDCKPKETQVPIELPRGPLYIRHEVDNYKLFISRAVFKNWLGKRFGEYSKVARELEDVRALRNKNARKVLGAGTTLGGAQQVCWAIDLKAPALGAVGLQLIQDGQTATDLKEMENG